MLCLYITLACKSVIPLGELLFFAQQARLFSKKKKISLKMTALYKFIVNKSGSKSLNFSYDHIPFVFRRLQCHFKDFSMQSTVDSNEWIVKL